jgi:D-alanyl-lipoteichoic acid acyltransferase DltB (MBOAT superfamily)
MYLAIFITMLLGGLWHGAVWTFVLWGMYHGVLLMINRFWQERKGDAPSPADNGAGVKLLKGFITFHLVCLGWLIFRSQSIGDAWTMTTNLFFAPLDFSGIPTRGLVVLIIGYFLHFTPIKLRDFLGDLFTRSPFLVQGTALALMLALINLLKNFSAPFIYFQF